MKIPLPLAGLFLLTPVYADLVITEVMSSSDHTDAQVDGDWWELTNTGPGSVNLLNYSWDDASDTPDLQIFNGLSIGAGESIIMLDVNSGVNVAAFRATWGIPGSTPILFEADFGGSFPGFSGATGDTIYLYDASDSIVDSWTFGASSDGQSFARFNDKSSVPGGVSVDGLYGATSSSESPADQGSPGSASVLPPPTSPGFILSDTTSWTAGRIFTSSKFRVVASDPNPDDNVSFTTISKPAWMTITDQGNGTARLSGTPTLGDVGTQMFEVEVEDDSGSTAAVSRVYTINILPEASPVILNEFNAVAADKYLNGGKKDDIGGNTDPFFGRISGNGGAWFELIAIGDGTAGSTTDLRGWTIQVDSTSTNRTLKLSNHDAWSAVPAGTILTFTALNTCQGGLDTHLHKTSNLTVSGTVWSNVWMYDPYLIDQISSSHPTTPAVSNDNTQITLLNASDVITYGPSGEGIGAKDTSNNLLPDSNITVSDTEMYKREQNPNILVDSFLDSYEDGGSSTFGQANKWSGGLMTQSFASYAFGNSPPVFSAIPPTHAAGGSYSTIVTTTDPNGQTPALSAPTLPSFLTFTDLANGTATLEANRPLTSADIGSYDVILLADDGQAQLSKTYLPFTFSVLHPSPALVLNEYNAVSAINYLNGGTFAVDSDLAPNTQDSHFGRVIGNGGDWFELVVTGDGGPGFTDLRGWTIAVGKADATNTFVATHTITLTNDSYWNAVPNGTILTFITKPTATGGLDTDLNKVNSLTVDGYAWSNIYLGDSSLVTGVSLTTIDIDSNGTQILISDALATPIFGPAGEGVAPKSGIGGTEILELEAHPTPSIDSRLAASLIDNGYDDGSSESTFGSPNSFLEIGGISNVPQDFTPYIFTPYMTWATGFSLADPSPGVDSDGDDSTNLEEYLYGGDPSDATSTPNPTLSGTSFSIDVRIDDPAYSPAPQWSTDLETWFNTDFTSGGSASSSFGASYLRQTYNYTGPAAPSLFFQMLQP